MRKSYLIVAHTGPLQVDRLVTRLSDGESRFFVHIDAKADIAGFDALRSCPEVTLVEPRIDCIWGTLGVVQAELAAARAALASGHQGYAILLSGQDYPIRSVDEINRYLTLHGDVVHVDIGPVEEVWPEHSADKTSRYNLALSPDKGHLALVPPLRTMTLRGAVGWTRRLVRLRGLRAGLKTAVRMLDDRVSPLGQEHAGSMWWAMPHEVLRDVVTFVDTHPTVLEYYEFTSCPDEILFHTVLQHLDSAAMRSRRTSLTHVEWPPGHSGSPHVFGVDDVERLLALPEGKLFARKFDTTLDAGILDVIDAVLDHETEPGVRALPSDARPRG